MIYAILYIVPHLLASCTFAFAFPDRMVTLLTLMCCCILIYLNVYEALILSPFKNLLICPKTKVLHNVLMAAVA